MKNMKENGIVKPPSVIIALLLSAAVFFLVLLFNPSIRAGDLGNSTYRSEEEEKTINVYKKTNDAVVFITTITLSVDPFDFFLELQPREGTGSGVIIDSAKGIILTNLHVIGEAHKIEITLSNGHNYKAKLLGFDNETDIAVLQLHSFPKDIKSIPLGDSSKLEVGQRILAIGNPFGLNRTLTSGIVSSLERTVKNPSGSLMKGLIQTDAAINPGNSGGPLLDNEGRLIGINTAILSQSGDSAGISFAVPINTIKRILPELIATGKVLRPSFGWILVDTNQGPFVLRIQPGGPAAEAGIEPIERKVKDMFLMGYVRSFETADLIVKVNGKKVTTKDDVETLITAAPSQQPVSLVLRKGGLDGNEREVTVYPVLK
jgi:S1-C subfamily serine protease